MDKADQPWVRKRRRRRAARGGAAGGVTVDWKRCSSCDGAASGRYTRRGTVRRNGRARGTRRREVRNMVQVKS